MHDHVWAVMMWPNYPDRTSYTLAFLCEDEDDVFDVIELVAANEVVFVERWCVDKPLEEMGEW